MRFLAALLLTALAASAQTNILKVSFADLGLEVRANRKIELRGVQTNLSAPYIISREYKSALTDTNGVCRFTNVVAGAYDLSLASTPPTIVRIGVTNSGTNVMEAYGLVNVASDGNAVQGYTQAAADARFYLRSNPSNYVTASITNGLGGGGTTYTNANIRVGLISGSSIGTNTSLLLSTNEFYSASNSMVSAWTASDAVVSNYVDSLSGAVLLRGTNAVRFSSLAIASSAWQAGDVVVLWGTNQITSDVVLPDRIMLRSLAGTRAVVETTNYFILTNYTVFEGIRFINPVTNALVIEKRGNTFVYGGTNDMRGVVFKNCEFLNAHGNIYITGDDTANTGVISLTVDGCLFEQSGTGLRVIYVSSNSVVTIRNSRFISVRDAAVGAEVLCSLRLNAGSNYVENCSITTQNAKTENIGIYSTAYLRVSGVTFPDCTVADGALPALNILLQTGAVVDDPEGCLKTSDYSFDSAVDTHTINNVQGPRGLFRGDQFSFSTSSSIPAAIRVRDAWQTFAFYNTRSAWTNDLAGYTYSSNSFEFLPHGATNNVTVSNANGISFSLWATNGLVVTNISGTVYLATAQTNDFIMVTNRGTTVGGIYSAGATLATNYTLISEYLTFRYNANKLVGGTVVVTNIAETVTPSSPRYYWFPQTNLTNWAYSRYGSGSRFNSLTSVECYALQDRGVELVLGSLTNIPAAQLTGTVPNARLDNTVLKTSDGWTGGFAVGTFDIEHTADGGTLNFSSEGTLSVGGTGEVLANAFAGDGSLLTSLNASQLTTGTVPTGRLTTAGTNLVGAVLTSDGVGGRYWTNVITGFSSVTATNIAVSGGMTNVGVFYQTNGTGWVSLTNGTIRASAFSATRFLVSDNTGLVGMAVGATASSALASGLSDETGTGAVVFNVSPTLNGLTVTNNATISGNIAATNGFVDIPRSSAPTFAQIGSRTNTPVMWWSNSAPCVRYVTYYNASSNEVTTNLFSLP